MHKRPAAALPTVNETVNQSSPDGTVRSAIAEAGLRGVRVPYGSRRDSDRWLGLPNQRQLSMSLVGWS